ncbi:MAG: hypothetical protein KDI79_26145 [Anaerolineae bacterium]|nr:hypothetical protein [Anaerolineae bacterium]
MKKKVAWGLVLALFLLSCNVAGVTPLYGFVVGTIIFMVRNKNTFLSDLGDYFFADQDKTRKLIRNFYLLHFASAMLGIIAPGVFFY